MTQPSNDSTQQWSTGGCLCGAIRFCCSQPLKRIVVCHCADCRRSSGAGAAYNIRVPADSVLIECGVPAQFEVIADSGDWLRRLFCAGCGSQLFHQREKLPDFITIKAGALDDSEGLAVSMHIWTQSTHSWVAIDPDKPSYPREYPGLRESSLPE